MGGPTGGRHPCQENNSLHLIAACCSWNLSCGWYVQHLRTLGQDVCSCFSCFMFVLLFCSCFPCCLHKSCSISAYRRSNLNLHQIRTVAISCSEMFGDSGGNSEWRSAHVGALDWVYLLVMFLLFPVLVMSVVLPSLAVHGCSVLNGSCSCSCSCCYCFLRRQDSGLQMLLLVATVLVFFFCVSVLAF